MERPHAWMERCKILGKNFERTLDTDMPNPGQLTFGRETLPVGIHGTQF